MKKITLLFLTFLAFQLGNAQATVWSDNFDDEDISDWTLTDSDGDGNNWGDQFVITNGTTPVTPVSLISRSWQTIPLTPDNWAVSPVIDLSGASGTITVEWITQVAAQSWDNEKYSVHVGTSNDITVLVNSSTSLTQVLGDAGNTGTPTPHSLDISSLAGSPAVYIAFRHWDCTDQDFLSVDDLTVLATTLSVDEFATNDFKTFYNKDSHLLTLESSTLAFDNIQMFNILGQEVMNKGLSQTLESVSLAELQDGVYIAKVGIEGQVQTVKLLKQ